MDLAFFVIYLLQQNITKYNLSDDLLGNLLIFHMHDCEVVGEDSDERQRLSQSLSSECSSNNEDVKLIYLCFSIALFF